MHLRNNQETTLGDSVGAANQFVPLWPINTHFVPLQNLKENSELRKKKEKRKFYTK
jgi:hypothetical protein